jgi:hypothetical protein
VCKTGSPFRLGASTADKVKRTPHQNVSVAPQAVVINLHHQMDVDVDVDVDMDFGI